MSGRLADSRALALRGKEPGFQSHGTLPPLAVPPEAGYVTPLGLAVFPCRIHPLIPAGCEGYPGSCEKTPACPVVSTPYLAAATRVLLA